MPFTASKEHGRRGEPVYWAPITQVDAHSDAKALKESLETVFPRTQKSNPEKEKRGSHATIVALSNAIASAACRCIEHMDFRSVINLKDTADQELRLRRREGR